MFLAEVIKYLAEKQKLKTVRVHANSKTGQNQNKSLKHREGDWNKTITKKMAKFKR